MKRVTASRTGMALQQFYPGDDVRVKREPGGVHATVAREDGNTVHFSIGDKPGILSAWLGIDDMDGGPHGDGGETASARIAA